MSCSFFNIKLRTCKDLKITQSDEKKNKREMGHKKGEKRVEEKKTNIALSFLYLFSFYGKRGNT